MPHTIKNIDKKELCVTENIPGLIYENLELNKDREERGRERGRGREGGREGEGGRAGEERRKG